jgi:hypothetical protein
LTGNQKLEAELTIKGGRVVWDPEGMTREDWRALPKVYGIQGDPSWDGVIAH